MSHTSPRQLLLLADHLKLSLLERQRAVSLNIDAGKQDAQITRSLEDLHDGLEQLEAHARDHETPEENDSDLSRLRKQYNELYAHFHGTAPTSSELKRPNDANLKQDFDAAIAAPQPRRSKSVRFRDNPDEDDPEHQANRTALLAEGERYRDEPQDSNQSQMDNEQIHAYHKQVIQDQDQQLQTLGQSVSRQRMLGIQIGDELDEHNVMLDDVESGVDRHQSTLDRARRRLENVARKGRQNWSWVTIGILIFILVLLIVVLK
ncbi:hypothetical protein BAUCODRAFT_116542 [Baudoinia panamericana UAMH 10762]|uniref:t-SNARE coiled-coil homology domain-containing protein n=1 Tax=Baudoinia panamericana (strain UAMH 10762) TaxID=717646 RepID=M2MYB7_BAUPA|nr:uncharacterized protein BAUCODRAFT_116542 [Baudoinia panamericana UAMH 10762]EMC91659.1 hypothetical protein BAUCODRAFT_116542 [Baudoinia panamericana UAMH 10762]